MFHRQLRAIFGEQASHLLDLIGRRRFNNLAHAALILRSYPNSGWCIPIPGVSPSRVQHQVERRFSVASQSFIFVITSRLQSARISVRTFSSTCKGMLYPEIHQPQSAYPIKMPPLTFSTCPVIYPASSDARNFTA